MKKTALSFLAILGFSSACAHVEYYAGAGVGLNQFIAKRATTIAGDGGFRYVTNQDNAGTSFMGDLFAGVRYRAYPYFIAGEIGGELSNAVITSTNSNYLFNLGLKAGLKIRKNGTFRLSVLPGYSISDKSDAFLRLGYARTRFSFASMDDTGGDLIPEGVERKETLSGFVLGAGMDTALTTSIRTRFEYLFSHYQAVNFTSNQHNQSGTEHVSSAHIRPVDHAVLLSFVMNFSS